MPSKIKKLLDPAAHPFLIPFFTVLVLFLFEATFFTPFFHVNDDDWTVFIAKGVGMGLRPDQHLFYNNVILGFILKALYSTQPKIQWYSCFLVFSQFCAFWAFLTALALNPNGKLKYALFTIAFLFFGLYYFSELNYTMISALALQSGVFLFPALFSDKPRPFRNKIMLLSATCLLLSCLLRLESFVFAMITVSPFILYTIWGKPVRTKDLLAASLLFVPILACITFDHSYYAHDPDWRQFTRSIHRVHPAIEWTAMEYTGPSIKTFDSIGWSQNDMLLFKSWYFVDSERYRPENLEKLTAEFPHEKVDFRGIFSYVVGSQVSQFMALCFFTFLLFCPIKRYPFLALHVFWVGILLLLLVTFAVLKERVYFPAFSFLVDLTIFYAFPPKAGARPHQDPSLPLGPRTRTLFLALLVAFLVPAFHQYRMTNLNQVANEELLKTNLRELNPRGDQLYVLWDSKFPYELISAFDDFELFRSFHIFALAPFQRSPIAQKMLDHFAVKDLFREMVDNPKMSLICGPYDGLLYHDYMKEKFGISIHAEKCFSCFYFKVYRIHSTKGTLPISRGKPEKKELGPGMKS